MYEISVESGGDGDCRGRVLTRGGMTLCAGPYSAYISTDLRRSSSSLYTYRLPVVYIPFFCRLKPMGFSSGAIGFRFASSQNTDMIPFRRYKRLFYWLSFFLFFVLFLKDYKWERTHLSVAVCGLAVIEESLEPVCVSFSKLFHMHHRRAKEMAHGELALFLYRWCYPFVSFRHKKRQRKEKSWSLLLAHLPAVYRTLIPTKRRIDRDLYSGLYMCLFINSNQVVSFYPLISLVELATVFFLSPFIFWRAGLCT